MRREVLIDARPLQGPSARRGIGSYVRGLLRGLEQAAPRFELSLLLDSARPRPEELPGLRAHEVRRRYHGRLAAYEDAVALPADLDRIRPALYHATSLSLPSRAPCPVAATCHDLIPWAWGGPWMLGERARYYPGKRLLRRAEAVLAVSDATAADATAFAGVLPARITVVPEGVDSVFQPAPGAADRVGARWGLAPGYLLYVGALDRRKDPVGLVRAWHGAQRAGAEVELVIAGVPGSQAPGRMGGARQLGRVTDDELADLYRGAACLVFPSLYEGFGLPVLEAMACGCPVVAYDTPAVAEVSGGAAALVKARDWHALGAEAARFVLDGELRTQAADAGRRRARPFTWERTAAATSSVYQSLLS